MAVSSYLPDVAGGMVAAAAFADDAAAQQAIEILAGSDVRPQEISVIARDDARAARIAGDRAWYPGKDARGFARLLRRVLGRLPRDVRRRYGSELAAGRVAIVAAASSTGSIYSMSQRSTGQGAPKSGGQPSDTLAALLSRAGGSLVDQWWQTPADLFAPPELAGPF